MSLLNHTMLRQADIFFDSSRKLTTLPIRNGILEPPTIPAIVLLAFACEVYIKFIVISRNNNVNKSHSLSDLFHGLPIEIQTEIINSTNTKNFESALTEISSTFIDWRYIYEKFDQVNSININFLYHFCDKLRNIAHAEKINIQN